MEQTQDQSTEVNLVVNAVAAWINKETNKVRINDKVDPIYLIEELLRALQAANQEVADLKKQLSEQKPKEETVKDI